MFVNPTHVVKQLPNGLVATLFKFKFDDYKISSRVNGKQINPAPTFVNCEFGPETPIPLV